MNSDTEKITDIIKNISKTEIRTLTQIQELNSEALHDIFKEFEGYPRNSENKMDILEELKEYQLIPYSNLYKGDHVAYCKTKQFWNIKLEKGKVVGQNKHGYYSVRMSPEKVVYVLPEYIFRKLSEEEKFKIKLIETVFTL
tara:strand:+ start:498 stop:920 length:423 start_codon:yes stop_codon:yes gene_type:complete